MRRVERAGRALATPFVVLGLLAGTGAALPGAALVVPDTALAPYVVEPGVELRPATDEWVLPVDRYRLTGRFGATSGLWATSHTGLDFAAPSGTPVRAVAAGTVVETGYDGAFGNKTVIELPDGTEVWYAHQSTTDAVVGQEVSAGQVIGSVGTTGNVTGPHLHLEVRPGPDQPVDPYAALVEHGARP